MIRLPIMPSKLNLGAKCGGVPAKVTNLITANGTFGLVIAHLITDAYGCMAIPSQAKNMLV